MLGMTGGEWALVTTLVLVIVVASSVGKLGAWVGGLFSKR